MVADYEADREDAVDVSLAVLWVLRVRWWRGMSFDGGIILMLLLLGRLVTVAVSRSEVRDKAK